MNQPLICRVLSWFGWQRCYFVHVRDDPDFGVYRCHCGAEHRGFKGGGIVVRPGETVTITVPIPGVSRRI